MARRMVHWKRSMGVVTPGKTSGRRLSSAGIMACTQMRRGRALRLGEGAIFPRSNLGDRKTKGTKGGALCDGVSRVPTEPTDVLVFQQELPFDGTGRLKRHVDLALFGTCKMI